MEAKNEQSEMGRLMLILLYGEGGTDRDSERVEEERRYEKGEG